MESAATIRGTYASTMPSTCQTKGEEEAEEEGVSVFVTPS
jgi:hypothetical protein